MYQIWYFLVGYIQNTFQAFYDLNQSLILTYFCDCYLVFLKETASLGFQDNQQVKNHDNLVTFWSKNIYYKGHLLIQNFIFLGVCLNFFYNVELRGYLISPIFEESIKDVDDAIGRQSHFFIFRYSLEDAMPGFLQSDINLRFKLKHKTFVQNNEQVNNT